MIALKKSQFPSKLNNKVFYNKGYNQISGSDWYSLNKKDLENQKGYIKKHGLIKTSLKALKKY